MQLASVDRMMHPQDGRAEIASLMAIAAPPRRRKKENMRSFIARNIGGKVRHLGRWRSDLGRDWNAIPGSIIPFPLNEPHWHCSPPADSRVPPRVARVVRNHTEPLAGHPPAVDGVESRVRHPEHVNVNSLSIKVIVALYDGDSVLRVSYTHIKFFEDHHDIVPSTGH